MTRALVSTQNDMHLPIVATSRSNHDQRMNFDSRCLGFAASGGMPMQAYSVDVTVISRK